jgi:hypothetical protein
VGALAPGDRAQQARARQERLTSFGLCGEVAPGLRRPGIRARGDDDREMSRTAGSCRRTGGFNRPWASGSWRRRPICRRSSGPRTPRRSSSGGLTRSGRGSGKRRGGHREGYGRRATTGVLASRLAVTAPMGESRSSRPAGRRCASNLLVAISVIDSVCRPIRSVWRENRRHVSLGILRRICSGPTLPRDGRARSRRAGGALQQETASRGRVKRCVRRAIAGAKPNQAAWWAQARGHPRSCYFLPSHLDDDPLDIAGRHLAVIGGPRRWSRPVQLKESSGQ